MIRQLWKEYILREKYKRAVMDNSDVTTLLREKRLEKSRKPLTVLTEEDIQKNRRKV